MKYQIEFYNTTVSEDSGGLISTPVKILTAWADVKGMDPARAMAYGVIENYRAYEIKTRYNALINNKLTIKHKNKTLTIHGVTNVDEMDFMLKIIAYEND